MKRGIVIGIAVLLLTASAFVGVKLFLPKKKDEDTDTPELNPDADPSKKSTDTKPSRTDPPSTPPRPNVIAPAPPTSPLAPGAFAPGSDAWVNKNSVSLYSYPSFGNPNYIAKSGFNLSVKKLGKYVEDATTGWAKISVDKPYGIDITGDYFVPKANLKNSAY